jgi:hypothetical protein
MKLHVFGICNCFISHYYNLLSPDITAFPSSAVTRKLFSFVSPQSHVSISKSLNLLDLGGIFLDETQGNWHHSLFINGYHDAEYYKIDYFP